MGENLANKLPHAPKINLSTSIEKYYTISKEKMGGLFKNKDGEFDFFVERS
ncbi:hypothetical protein OAM01_00215 [bacterium]|nr:hypothetical protein [bacterium]